MTDEVGVGSLFAGHRLEAVIGRGGMGIVYRATHLGLERQVALKVINPQFAADLTFRERFKRESRAAGALRHPNIVTVHDAGEFDGHLYITMELIDGSDLAQEFRERRVGDAFSLQLARQIGSALDAAHARGLVHRDVKPANILVEDRDGSVHFYLTDFGLTRHMSSVGGITKTGQWMGTLDYVAPEQIQGERIDGRADTYALGCVVFEALSGRAPFDQESDIAKMWAQVHEPPPDLEQFSISARVSSCVKRAMAKDPDERYPSAGDVGRALTEAGLGSTSASMPRSRRTAADTVVRQILEDEWTGDDVLDDRRRSGKPSVAERRSKLLIVASGASLFLGLILVLLLTGVFFGDGGDDSDETPAIVEGGTRTSSSPDTSTVLIQSLLDGAQVGGGSGWVYDADEGIIVTNAHVIGTGSDVLAGNDEVMRQAEVVAVARCSDLAVVRIEPIPGMTQVRLGEQSQLRRGIPVSVLGFSTGLSPGEKVQAGKGRVTNPFTRLDASAVYLPNVVEASATINYGNSGGPMVNQQGELIGVNTANSDAPPGRGIAIGVEEVRKIVPSLIEGNSSSWIGFGSQPVFIESQGRYFHEIKAVVPGTEAARVGLMAGDLVSEINGVTVGGGQAYCRATNGIGSGETVSMEVLRQGDGGYETRELSVTF